MTTYNIRKLRSGRIADENPATWVGQLGTIFYNEATGALRISDGVTPGGVNLPFAIASTTEVGGIKAGPGANVSVDGTLTIDTAGLPLAIGNVQINDTTISAITTNADIVVASNGTGNVELVGNVHFHTTAGGPASEPYFLANEDGQITIKVPAADPVAGAVKIVGSQTGSVFPPLNTGVMLQLTGNNNDPSRLYNDGINNFPAFVGRRINGNLTVPTAVVAGDDLLRISVTGHNGVTVPGSGSGRILFQALETHTPTVASSNISIWTTPIGSNVLTKTATFDVATGVTLTKATVQGNLTVQGNIVGNAIATVASLGSATVTGNITANAATIGNIAIINNTIHSILPDIEVNIGLLTATANVNINRTTVVARDLFASGNVYVGANKAISTPRVLINDGGIRTILDGVYANMSFATDSIVHCFNPSGDLTVNLNGYTAGATIRLLVSMNTRRSINYGVAAPRNSTTGAISINSTALVDNQCVQLTYTCMDGTSANTYVAVSRV